MLFHCHLKRLEYTYSLNCTKKKSTIHKILFLEKLSLNNNELNNKSIIDPIHTTRYIYRVPEKQAGVRSPARERLQFLEMRFILLFNIEAGCIRIHRELSVAVEIDGRGRMERRFTVKQLHRSFNRLPGRERDLIRNKV